MKPLISFIIPLLEKKAHDDTSAIEEFIKTIRSIEGQLINNYEIIAPVNQKYFKGASKIFSSAKNLKLINSKSQSYSQLCLRALTFCSGKYISVIRHGDQINEHYTYEIHKADKSKRNVKLIYSDQDSIDQQGQRFNPRFKPAPSPDLLFSQNYIGYFYAINKEFLLGLGSFRPKYQIAFAYDVLLKTFLKILQASKDRIPKKINAQIIHIPKILFHSRKELRDNERNKELNEEFSILKENLILTEGVKSIKHIKPGVFYVQRELPKIKPLVSIIIPTKDKPLLIKKCILSILNRTAYKNYEIIVVDNNSTDTKAINFLKLMESKFSKIKVFKYNKEFNYSAINNWAAGLASGEIICFLNNDTEVISRNWLSEMASQAIRPDVGCVGAMLYYKNKYIQHGGVVVGMHGLADHAFSGLKKNRSNDYFNYLYSIRNLMAVTGAALMVRKQVFVEVGGFDSRNLKIAFNDVDLCLKIFSKGYFNIWTPYAELYHHESATRGPDSGNSLNAKIRDQKEISYMKKKWRKQITIADNDLLSAWKLNNSFF